MRALGRNNDAAKC